MGTVDDATATQIQNLEARTGKTVDALIALVNAQELPKHSAKVAWLKQTLGMGHGDANLVVHLAKQADAPAPPADPADGWYTGKKAHLRPIHEAVLAAVAELGEPEHAPKKSYLSLRRSKQFAMVGPATNSQVEVGLNLGDHPTTDRLKPATGMCSHKVRLASPTEVDDALRAWLKTAWDRAE